MKIDLPVKLILCCLMVSMAMPLTSFSQTLSFTTIPYSDPDLNAPGRGVEQWHDKNLINVPNDETSTQRLDAYHRFTWNRLETTQDNYVWTYLDNLFKDCIEKRQKISFGIMTCYPDGKDEETGLLQPGVIAYGDGNSAYPEYLHTLMQAETDKDWKTFNAAPTTGYGAWVPNWNSPSYLARLLALYQAVNNHINTTSYQGVAFKDIVSSIDIRGYGAWGEWHSGRIIQLMASYPTGTRATTATLKTIINHHITAFPDFPLSIMISTFDAERMQNTETPKELAAYALLKSNNKGKFGWRRDNWGALDEVHEYIDDYLIDNNQTFVSSDPFYASITGIPFKTIITERWKEAPVTGEPPNWLPASEGLCPYHDLENQIVKYHATSFGNGNYGTDDPPECMQDFIRAASKAAGYRIILEGGNISSPFLRGTPFSITLNWKNIGIAPTYETWSVSYELKNSSNVVVWSAASSFIPNKQFLPSATATIHTDNNLTIPTSVPNGNYTLNLIIKDPSGYRAPLPLAITGRNADGSYTLKTISFTSTPITFTSIPFTDADLNAPARGVEQWFNENTVNVPVEGTNTQRLDVYHRLVWNQLETTQDNYTWTYFDQLFNTCITNKQKISFGIMTCVPEGSGLAGILEYGNGNAAYPLYLHNLMQAETIKDWKTDGTGATTSAGTWVPNWNSPSYLARLLALYQAINNHLNTTSYNGVLYKDIVGTIDVRGYGAWGEWHSAQIVESMTGYPTGTKATVATLKTIIDHHATAFPNFPLLLMMYAFDAEWLQNTYIPLEVTSYALGKSNSWGLLGWRRDNFGAFDQYITDYLENNTRSYNSGPEFQLAIMNRWKYAPVKGELPGWLPLLNGPCGLDDLERQIRLYHVSSFGNGNYGSPTLTTCEKNNVRAASKASGYRIIVEAGAITTTITRGTPFTVTLDWKNVGIAPTYENWNVAFELKNSSNAVAWTGTSSFLPKLFLPSTSATSVTDNLTIPVTVPDGSYTLNLIIKDPAGFRNPLPLAIAGRNTDGSYTLKNITFSGCTPPTAVLAHTTTCNGNGFNLTLSTASGASPYDLVINGVTYNDKTSGNTITSITPTVQKIWSTNPTVGNNEGGPVELGVKFRSTVSGYIKGIRFFSSVDVGDHYVGHLWSSTGTSLGTTAEFAGVTPNTWNEALFSTPVHVDANTTYVASYFTSDGYYASTSAGLTSAVSNGESLTALAGSTSGGNGVYVYGANGGFPNSSFMNANYWADVIFVPDTYTFNLTSITDNNGCISTGSPLQALVVESDPCTGGRPAVQVTGTKTTPPLQTWEYALKQSYPNPSPGNAKIVYQLPHPTMVNLSLFDVQGRLIKVLASGIKDRGEHIVNADLAPLAKGIYYYKLNTKEFSAARKLIIQ